MWFSPIPAVRPLLKRPFLGVGVAALCAQGDQCPECLRLAFLVRALATDSGLHVRRNLDKLALANLNGLKFRCKPLAAIGAAGRGGPANLHKTVSAGDGRWRAFTAATVAAFRSFEAPLARIVGESVPCAV